MIRKVKSYNVKERMTVEEYNEFVRSSAERYGGLMNAPEHVRFQVLYCKVTRPTTPAYTQGEMSMEAGK